MLFGSHHPFEILQNTFKYDGGFTLTKLCNKPLSRIAFVFAAIARFTSGYHVSRNGSDATRIGNRDKVIGGYRVPQSLLTTTVCTTVIEILNRLLPVLMRVRIWQPYLCSTAAARLVAIVRPCFVWIVERPLSRTFNGVHCMGTTICAGVHLYAFLIGGVISFAGQSQFLWIILAPLSALLQIRFTVIGIEDALKFSTSLWIGFIPLAIVFTSLIYMISVVRTGLSRHAGLTPAFEPVFVSWRRRKVLRSGQIIVAAFSAAFKWIGDIQHSNLSTLLLECMAGTGSRNPVVRRVIKPSQAHKYYTTNWRFEAIYG